MLTATITINEERKTARCKETLALCSKYAVSVSPVPTGTAYLFLYDRTNLPKVWPFDPGMDWAAPDAKENDLFCYAELTSGAGELDLRVERLVKKLTKTTPVGGIANIAFAVYAASNGGLCGAGELEVLVEDVTETTENQSVVKFQGPKGTGIEKIEFKEEDEEGNFIYEVTLTDGTKEEFKSPKGPRGASARFGWIKDENGKYHKLTAQTEDEDTGELICVVDKEEYDEPEDDTDVVYKAGAQTITGNKTFTGETNAVTENDNENSTKVATTAWVRARIAAWWTAIKDTAIIWTKKHVFNLGIEVPYKLLDYYSDDEVPNKKSVRKAIDSATEPINGIPTKEDLESYITLVGDNYLSTRSVSGDPIGTAWNAGVTKGGIKTWLTTTIFPAAFKGATGLMTILLNDEITICESAFEDCADLWNALYEQDAPAYLDRVELGRNVTLGDNAFKGCNNEHFIGLRIYPATVGLGAAGKAAIGQNVFSGCTHLTRLMIAGANGSGRHAPKPFTALSIYKHENFPFGIGTTINNSIFVESIDTVDEAETIVNRWQIVYGKNNSNTNAWVMFRSGVFHLWDSEGETWDDWFGSLKINPDTEEEEVIDYDYAEAYYDTTNSKWRMKYYDRLFDWETPIGESNPRWVEKEA